MAENSFTPINTGLKTYNHTLENDNLFAGIWNLDQAKLDQFDPFIKGYSFFIWTKLPVFLTKLSDSRGNLGDFFKRITEKNFKTFNGVSDMTLDMEEITTGFAGNTMAVATNLRKENTSFNMTHYEFSGSPIRDIYQTWITGIRDPETGLSHYHGADLTYSMKHHSGELLYIVTDPTGSENGIEFACYYTNVIPTKIPQSHLEYSSGDHGIVEIDIEFRGNFHQSQAINKLAIDALKNYKITSKFNNYAIDTVDKLKINDGYGGGIFTRS